MDTLTVTASAAAPFTVELTSFVIEGCAWLIKPRQVNVTYIGMYYGPLPDVHEVGRERASMFRFVADAPGTYQIDATLHAADEHALPTPASPVVLSRTIDVTVTG